MVKRNNKQQSTSVVLGIKSLIMLGVTMFASIMSIMILGVATLYVFGATILGLLIGASAVYHIITFWLFLLMLSLGVVANYILPYIVRRKLYGESK